jgi:hypothetical protein
LGSVQTLETARKPQRHSPRQNKLRSEFSKSTSCANCECPCISPGFNTFILTFMFPRTPRYTETNPPSLIHLLQYMDLQLVHCMMNLCAIFSCTSGCRSTCWMHTRPKGSPRHSEK